MNPRLKLANSRYLLKVALGCVICLFLVLALHIHAQNQAKEDVIATKPEFSTAKQKAMASRQKALAARKGIPQQARARNRTSSRKIDYGKHAEFYRVIIDYNLFRPLGWAPKKSEPQYSLIGTVVDTNSTIAQAIVLEKRSNQYHVVTIGEKIGEVTVTDIQAKQITLDQAGKPLTLKTSSLQFLSASRGTGKGGNPRTQQAGENKTNERGNANANAADRGRANLQKMKAEMAEKFQNASKEERERMMEEFKEKEAEMREQVEIRRKEARERRANRRRRDR